MKTYFEAYRERLERNDLMLRDFAEKLKESGCSVTTYSKPGELISGYMVVKGIKHCTIYFSEVPYRWTIGISIKPNAKTGSGYTTKTFTDYTCIPFTVNEIFELMEPVPEGFKQHPHEL